VEGCAGGGEEVVGRHAGAGAVRAPLVTEEAGVGIDVGVLRWIGGAGSVGAVLWVSAIVVLGPETVENEGRVTGALRGSLMGDAELGRPREVEEIVVEGLCGVAGWDGRCRGAGARSGLGRGLWGWGAAGERKNDEKSRRDFLLHGGRRIARVFEGRQRARPRGVP